MLEEDKLALESSTAAIRCKIIVKATDTLPEIILTDEDAIKDWTYTDDRYVPQQGFIGQFVARTLEGNLQDVDDDFNIENREIELMIGIVKLGSRFTYVVTEEGTRLLTEQGEYIIVSDLGEDETNWYSYGNFIVTNPEGDEVSDNTKFEAMDYAKLFNKAFDAGFVSETYPQSYNDIVYVDEETGEPTGSVTALWLAQYTCAQVNVEFPQELFTNSDFIIDRNPFQAGETCRDVMKAIGQLAFSWVRIDWDNKCYIDFAENSAAMLTDDAYNTIDNNQYYSLETKKEIYGPINAVYIGMSNIDGETLCVAKDEDSILANGEHPLYIYDNPLTYTPTLRKQLEANGSGYKLIGLSYNQLTTETVGHPWLKGNELITIVDMEDNPRTTFAFNKTIEYSGHIKTTLDSMGETEVETTLAYKNEVIRSTKNAMILVDKANGRITLVADKVDDVEGELEENYYTKKQTSEAIQDATTGWTNTYTSMGGNNRIRNSGLYFEDSSGFEYWEGVCKKVSNVMAVSQTALSLQTGEFKQTITGLPKGDYTISFQYDIINSLSINTVLVEVDSNTFSFELNSYISSKGDDALKLFDEVFTVGNTGTLSITFKTDINDACIVYDLICNVGLSALNWTQHPNEITTDTVNISKGITITSSADKDITFKANYDGVRIENSSGETPTEFTNRGTITNELTVNGKSEITGVRFQKTGKQTWLTGI